MSKITGTLERKKESEVKADGRFDILSTTERIAKSIACAIDFTTTVLSDTHTLARQAVVLMRTWGDVPASENELPMIFKLEDPDDGSVDWLFIITVGDGKLSLTLDTFHELTNLTTETPITFGAKLDCGDLASMKVCENHKVRGEGVPLTLTEIRREYKATPNAP